VLGKSALGLLDFLVRALVSIVVPMVLKRIVPAPLPFPVLVGIGEMTFYLSLCFFSPRLHSILLSDRVRSKVQSFEHISHTFVLTAEQVKVRCLRVPVTAFWGTPIETASQVKFMGTVTATRNRKIEESFLDNLVLMLIVVLLTGALAFVLSYATPDEFKKDPFSPLSLLVSFAQALIELIPFIWTFGTLYGEINCHRDTVFRAIGEDV
jgi:hypothetical protein